MTSKDDKKGISLSVAE
jgi:hypothetical protein